MKFELTDLPQEAPHKKEICSLRTMRQGVVFQVMDSVSVAYALKLNEVVILVRQDNAVDALPTLSCSTNEFEMTPLPDKKSLTLTLSNKGK